MMDRYLKLAIFIDRVKHDPFEWGVMDCCTFAAKAVEAQTGVDPLKKFPHYETEEDAAKIIEARGGVEAIATSVLGQPIPPKTAQRGDVVMAECGRGDTLGICLGNRFAVVAKDGLAFAPMRMAKRAWRVG